MSKPELCPMCKNGNLRPIGKASTIRESDKQFIPVVHMQELQCDKCGHTQKAASLTEHTPINDDVDATKGRTETQAKLWKEEKEN